MKKLSPLGNDYCIEQRLIGNDKVGDGICRWRSRTRVESMASRNFVNLFQVFFLSALALGLGLPHQSTLAAPIMVGLGGKIALDDGRSSHQRTSRRASAS